eukprot:SAG11_NODE_1772_length_4273_cov_3.739578_4_plen_87_part_00
MKEFIGAILASVNTTDGWVGPGARPVNNGKKGDGNIYWVFQKAIFRKAVFRKRLLRVGPEQLPICAAVPLPGGSSHGRAGATPCSR